MTGRRSVDKHDKWTTILGIVLIIASLSWRFGIGESSDLVFLFVFGFGCYLLSKENLIQFISKWKSSGSITD